MTTLETSAKPYTSSAQTSGKPWWLIITALVLIAVAAVLYINRSWFIAAEQTENAELYTVERRSFPIILEEKGELEAAKSTMIRSELEGRATIIFLIEEGVRAKEGDLLVELASDEIEERIRDAEIRDATAKAAQEASVKEHEILLSKNASAIRKAQLALELATLDLKRYEEGERVENEQDAKLALDKAKNVLKRSKAFYEDSKELHKQGYITRIELENDEFKAYEAQIELEKATTGLEVLEKYTTPMELREKQSAVDEAEKEIERETNASAAAEAKSEADVEGKKAEYELIHSKLEKYREQKEKSRIVAPSEGLVVYAREGWHRREAMISEGEEVHERQNLIELPDTSQMKVVVRVQEAQTEYLKLDATATMEIEGFSGQHFTGKVTKIAVLADSQNRWLNPNLKEYETEIMLDGTQTKLKPGATAHVTIQLAYVYDVLSVPVQAVFSSGGKYYVFVETAEKSEPREVQIGLNSNEFVEISAGLEEGQKVRLVVTEEEKFQLPNGEKNDNRKRDVTENTQSIPVAITE